MRNVHISVALGWWSEPQRILEAEKGVKTKEQTRNPKQLLERNAEEDCRVEH